MADRQRIANYAGAGAVAAHALQRAWGGAAVGFHVPDHWLDGSASAQVEAVKLVTQLYRLSSLCRAIQANTSFAIKDVQISRIKAKSNNVAGNKG